MGSSQTLALKLWIAFVWYPFSGERFLIANFYKWRSYYAGKRPGIFLNDFRATENWDGGVYLNVHKEEQTNKLGFLVLYLPNVFIHYPKWTHRYHRERPERDGPLPILPPQPALACILQAPGIWHDWQWRKHLLTCTCNLLEVPNPFLL